MYILKVCDIWYTLPNNPAKGFFFFLTIYTPISTMWEDSSVIIIFFFFLKKQTPNIAK